MRILRDYTDSELRDFERYGKNRYDKMCIIIGESMLKYNQYENFILILLPSNDNKGCITINRYELDETTTVLDNVYF